MPGELQPLVSNQAIVDALGQPTQYFIRWAQQRQIDIGEGISAADAQALIDDWAANRKLTAGTGLIGGGTLDADREFALGDTLVVPGTYGDSTSIPQLVIDQQGRVQAATTVPASGGGGGGGPWYRNPPKAADFPDRLSSSAILPTAIDDADLGLVVGFGGPSLGGTIGRVVAKSVPAPGINWSVSARFDINALPFNFYAMGIFAVETSNKQMMCITGSFDGTPIVQHRNGSLAGAFYSATGSAGGNPRDAFYRLDYNAAANTYSSYVSYDGKNWFLFVTYNWNNAFSVRADKVGLGIWTGYGRAEPLNLNCDYWKQSW